MNQSNRNTKFSKSVHSPNLVMKSKPRYFLVHIYCYWKFSHQSCIVVKTDCLKRADFICFMIFPVQTRTGSTQTNYICSQNAPGQGEIKGEHDTWRYGNIKRLRNVFITIIVLLALCFAVFVSCLLWRSTTEALWHNYCSQHYIFITSAEILPLHKTKAQMLPRRV